MSEFTDMLELYDELPDNVCRCGGHKFANETVCDYCQEVEASYDYDRVRADRFDRDGRREDIYQARMIPSGPMC